MGRIKGEVSAFPMETGVNLIVVDSLDDVVVVLEVPMLSESVDEKKK